MRSRDLGFLLKKKLRELNFRSAQVWSVLHGDLQIIPFKDAYFLCQKNSKLETLLIKNPSTYDTGNFAIIEKILKSGDNFIDVGANIGIYSLVASRIVGPSGSVFSFEPVSSIFNKLTKNIALNAPSNISAVNAALSSFSGTTEILSVNEDQFRQGTSTLQFNDNVQEMGEGSFSNEQVSVLTLDHYLEQKQLKTLKFIKIDVEGHELKVLEGAKSTLIKLKPFLLLEHDQSRLRFMEISELDFQDLFKTLGYLCYEIIFTENQIKLREFSFVSSLETNNILCCHLDKVKMLSNYFSLIT
jgi:FkbM family methyltransferase